MSDQKLFAGHAVRRIRRASGLTQSAMAEALGVSPSYLNLIERNQRPLTAALMLRLADRFDFDPRTLSGTAPGGGVEAIRRRLADPVFADLALDRAVGLGEEQAGYLTRVMRLAAGDELWAVGGWRRWGCCCFGGSNSAITAGSGSSRRPVGITPAQASGVFPHIT